MTWTDTTTGVANWYDSAGYGEFLYGETLFGGGEAGSWSQVTNGIVGWNLNQNGLGISGLGVLGLGQTDNQANWAENSIYQITWS